METYKGMTLEQLKNLNLEVLSDADKAYVEARIELLETQARLASAESERDTAKQALDAAKSDEDDEDGDGDGDEGDDECDGEGNDSADEDEDEDGDDDESDEDEDGDGDEGDNGDGNDNSNQLAQAQAQVQKLQGEVDTQNTNIVSITERLEGLEGQAKKDRAVAAEVHFNKVTASLGETNPGVIALKEQLNFEEVTDEQIDTAVKPIIEMAKQGWLANRPEVGDVRITEDKVDKVQHLARAFVEGRAFKPEGSDTTFESAVSYANFMRLAGNGQYMEPVELWEDFVRAYNALPDVEDLNEHGLTIATNEGYGEVLQREIIQAAARSYDESQFNAGWRPLVSRVRSVSDFNEAKTSVLGVYEELAKVDENQPVQNFDSAGAYQVPITVESFQNIEGVTRQSFMNDSAGVVQQLPGRLGDAGARTVYRAVIAMVFSTTVRVFEIRDSDTTATSALLYSATGAESHANLRSASGGVTIFNYANIVSALEAMALQTAFTRAQNVPAGNFSMAGTNDVNCRLVVPGNMRRSAQALVSATSEPGNANNDPNKISDMTVVPALLGAPDANNWAIVSDPARVNTIFMNFLAGRTRPLVQRDPSRRADFTHNRIEWKAGLDFALAPVDFRGFYLVNNSA